MTGHFLDVVGIPVIDEALRSRLQLMLLEREAGIADRSDAERNLLAAIALSRGPDGLAPARDLRQHPLVRRMTHPTYHRVLRGLIERGYVEYETSQGRSRGYRLTLRPDLSRSDSI